MKQIYNSIKDIDTEELIKYLPTYKKKQTLSLPIFEEIHSTKSDIKLHIIADNNKEWELKIANNDDDDNNIDDINITTGSESVWQRLLNWSSLISNMSIGSSSSSSNISSSSSNISSSSSGSSSINKEKTSTIMSSNNNKPNDNKDSCILRWAYLYNSEWGSSYHSYLTKMKHQDLFKFEKTSRLFYPQDKELYPQDKEFYQLNNGCDIYTVTIDDECRSKMDSSKIYCLMIKRPIGVERFMCIRMFIEYNDTISEIKIIDRHDLRRIDHIWGGFVKSNKENIIHFVPHNMPVTSTNKPTPIFDGMYICCNSKAPTIYSKIQKLHDTNEKECKDSQITELPNDHQSIIVIPFTKTMCQRLDELLYHLKNVQFDKIFLIVDNYRENKMFNSIEEFEQKMSDPLFIKNSKEYDCWIDNLYNLIDKNVKMNNCNSTWMMLFENDLKNNLNQLDDRPISDINCKFFIITQSKDIQDPNVFWKVFNTYFRTAIGPYCEFTLLTPSEKILMECPIPYLLTRTTTSSYSEQEMSLPSIVPFIKYNDLFHYGIQLNNKFYRFSYSLAKALFEIIDVDDCFFYLFSRMHEGWVRECIKEFIFLMNCNKTNNHRINDHKSLLNKLIEVSQNRDLDINLESYKNNLINRQYLLKELIS